MQQLKSDPLWDEGISSFLYGEYEEHQRPLTINDLQAFAQQQAVRIGDILETMFLMAIYGEWTYTNEQGDPMQLDEDALNSLYAKGRLSADDLAVFTGVWQPAE